MQTEEYADEVHTDGKNNKKEKKDEYTDSPDKDFKEKITALLVENGTLKKKIEQLACFNDVLQKENKKYKKILQDINELSKLRSSNYEENEIISCGSSEVLPYSKKPGKQVKKHPLSPKTPKRSLLPEFNGNIAMAHSTPRSTNVEKNDSMDSKGDPNLHENKSSSGLDAVSLDPKFVPLNKKNADGERLTHLGHGLYLVYDEFAEKLETSKSVSIFIEKVLNLIYTEEEITKRCLDVSKGGKTPSGKHNRKQYTPKKLSALRDAADHYLSKTGKLLLKSIREAKLNSEFRKAVSKATTKLCGQKKGEKSSGEKSSEEN